MKTAIIIHGMPNKEKYYKNDGPSESNSHWLPWIQKELLVKDILAQTPEMPHPYNPEYNAWKQTFEQFELNEDTILIGHSCGGGFIVRYLSENDIKVGKVVLIAPWIDLEKILDTRMFDFTINVNLVSKTKGVTIFSSLNDKQYIQDNITELKNKIKDIKIVEFKNMSHFCFKDMKTEKFPELLEEALN